ncbi:hypothetical protein [Pseudomonas nabeulensis]|uniref:hypothetical protein n=1 Tax=Pseudomonas nabeulensis TaxID=2293833 RepID=UPI0010766FBE|nr:hypothetical protein [Pseudomonas nabeulensis]
MILAIGLIETLSVVSDVMVKIMKSLIEFGCGVNSKKSKFALLVALVVSVNAGVYAAEGVINKSETPNAVLVLSDSNTVRRTGFVIFSIRNSDFPSGTALDSKRLVDIQWSTTYYPDSINEIVSLCYQRVLSAPEDCREIRPNSVGLLSDFNGEYFNYISRVKIYHKVLGGKPPTSRPAGVDSVVIRYRY